MGEIAPRTFDWAAVGRTVRQGRIIRGLTQEELARRTGLSSSTIYHVERGEPVGRRSLQRISAVFGHSLEALTSRPQNVVTEATGPLQHRAGERIWTADAERRPKVPEDDFARIQDPQERLRLGRLGLVRAFLCSLGFIMPEGPGPLFIELYGRVEEAINAEVYRDALLMCTSGAVRAGIGGREVEMAAGDVVGYRSRELAWIEPVEGSALPATLTWIGAVRIGAPPPVERGTQRVRRRKTPDAE